MNEIKKKLIINIIFIVFLIVFFLAILDIIRKMIYNNV